jgi:hypothetical protein
MYMVCSLIPSFKNGSSMSLISFCPSRISIKGGSGRKKEGVCGPSRISIKGGSGRKKEGACRSGWWHWQLQGKASGRSGWWQLTTARQVEVALGGV